MVNAAVPPGQTRYPLYRRMGGSQDRSGSVREISPLPGFDPRTVQPVASCYTYYAIAVHIHIYRNLKSHINSDLSLTFCRQEIPVSLQNSWSYIISVS